MDTFTQLRDNLRAVCPDLELKEGEALGRHTSFRIGGSVPLMALPKTGEEASVVVEAARGFGVAPFFLGKGSNLLVADAGADIFVVKCCVEEIKLLEKDGLYLGAGVTLAQAAVFAMEQGLSGLEFAHGIPGTVGGAVVMNAGAYDGEMSQVIQWVDYLDEEGRMGRLSAADCQLSYRHSVFSDGSRLILGAMVRLMPDAPEAIRGRMMDLMERRKSKQPLEFPSAGSTFKRPPGHFAGGLIQQCGLKGARVGGAQVSEKHAGFVINTGDATCADVLGLMRLVRDTVQKETGVTLEPEVKFIGCSL